MPLVPIKNIFWFSHNKWDKHLISSKKDLSRVPMFVSHNGIGVFDITNIGIGFFENSNIGVGIGIGVFDVTNIGFGIGIGNYWYCFFCTVLF